MTVPEVINQLISRFEDNLEAYRSGDYNEAQLRSEFLDPFFEALGWDMYNKQGYAEAYKDVIHEDSIKMGGATKAPDYAFRIGGMRKFFVEAKKPSVKIKDAIEPAYQLRRYAWSAKLPLSILTDFEEFAIYECRSKPDQADKASTGRIMFLNYKDYVDKWDDIAAIFSREAIFKGAFDRYAETATGKRGTAEVDDSFLAEIERWRSLLAHNIALRNPILSQRELNYAVQMTIDRIIFLRICEDRGIEFYGALQALFNGSETYPRMCQLFKNADDRYNSGLFHFRPEKDRRDSPDKLTLSLVIDDKPLKDILQNLYYPDSPYEFSVLPADILGQVYEQFLGKVIRLTSGHHAVVEDKPEVKKAGGVYYTPTYIVDYIVKHTVGALLEAKKPGEKGVGGKGDPLRVLDPACGSGSFLLGAYQYLLDWYRDGYIADGVEKWSKGRNPTIYQGLDGEWRLTGAERKRILLDHIYGVDIDSQAVEVTKLSLLLKVLEGENKETLGKQLSMFRERALPDLGDNIKCGNSLIGPDFYTQRQTSFLDEEERYRINAFDWQAEFPQVFAIQSERGGDRLPSPTGRGAGGEVQTGGFDVVIGNPPWLMAGYYLDKDLDYLRSKYKTAKGKFDLYYTFIEKGCYLLLDKGIFGLIVPNKFFHTKAATSLRSLLSRSKWVRTLVDFGDEQIFSGATNYSCIIFLNKRSGPNPIYRKVKSGLIIQQEFEVPWEILTSENWYFGKQNIRDIFKKLDESGQHLERITTRFGTGVQSGADRLFILDYSEAEAIRIELRILKPIRKGRDIRRYSVSESQKFLIFPYQVHDDEFTILSENELQKYENAYNHLFRNKQKLSQRVWFGKGAEELSGKWYGLMYLDSYLSFAHPHILTPSLSNHSNFALGKGELFVTGTAGVTSIILNSNITENIHFILGLLNSTLINFYIINHSPVFSGGYYKFSAPYLKKIPIRRIDFLNPSDIGCHDHIGNLVERIIALYKQLASAKTPIDKIFLQREIETIDKEIDALVYELYGLTEEEIKIVEQG